MKPSVILAIGILAGSIAGCRSAQTEPPPDNFAMHRPLQNVWMTGQVQKDMVANAIIAQHAIMPYHFIANSLGALYD